MTAFELPYGRETRSITISTGHQPTLILPNQTPGLVDPQAAIRAALQAPLGFDWARLRAGMKVAITINDKTRPVPNHLLLPPLFEQLERCGVTAADVTLWIASGSHTPMRPDEYPLVLPRELIQRYRVQPHDTDQAENLTFLGETSRGTPVWVNRAFYETDLRIVVGDVEPHHFAGFSGGYKSAAIGMAGRATINHNHKMFSHPQAWIGVYAENPLRQDIEEIGDRMQVDLALNAVLNQTKQVAAVFCGQPRRVIQAAIPSVLQACATPYQAEFDLVVASAGGHPKDINFYQAQKALTHASTFAKPGGAIILLAACPEGTGNRAYEEFMQGVTSLEEVFRRFDQMEFHVGPHKALQVARLLQHHAISLVSEIPSEMVRRLMMPPADSAQQACDTFLTAHPQGCRVAVLPHATTTLAGMA
jgi:nickel-dependent lactate racemase